MHLQQLGAVEHYSYRVAYTDVNAADKARVILGALLYALLLLLWFCH